MSMITDYIGAGSEVLINGGYLVINGHNGSGLYDCSEFEIDEKFNPVAAGERRLTLHEIEHLMKEADGHNHKLEWLDDTALPFC